MSCFPISEHQVLKRRKGKQQTESCFLLCVIKNLEISPSSLPCDSVVICFSFPALFLQSCKKVKEKEKMADTQANLRVHISVWRNRYEEKNKTVLRCEVKPSSTNGGPRFHKESEANPKPIAWFASVHVPNAFPGRSKGLDCLRASSSC